MIFDQSKLTKKATTRPAGYAAEVIAASTLLPDGRYELPETEWHRLAHKFRTGDHGPAKTVGWRKKGCKTCAPIVTTVRSTNNSN